MKKIRAAVVGYGNIGKFTLEALEAAPDFEVAGIVRRHGAENKPAELANYEVVKDIKELKDVDVAILATPTRSVEQYAKKSSHSVSTPWTALISIRKSATCAVHWAKWLRQTIPYRLFRQAGTREVTR